MESIAKDNRAKFRSKRTSASICLDRRGAGASDARKGIPGFGVDCREDAGDPVELSEAAARGLAADARTSEETEGPDDEMADSAASVVA